MFNNLCILFPGAASLFKGYVYLVLEFKINLKKERQINKNQLVSGAEFYGGMFIQEAIFILFNKFSRGYVFFLIQGVCLFQSLE